MAYSRTPYSRTPYSRQFDNSNIIEVSFLLTPAPPTHVSGYLVAASLDLTPATPVCETIPGPIEVDLEFSVAVISKQYIALDSLNLARISVSRGVTDDVWAMDATIAGYQVLNLDVLRHATFTTTDHLGNPQHIFAGILPKSSPKIQEANNQTTISGYDYAWYLSRQTVPVAYQHNTAGTNPADIIRGLLGGTLWEETTGIEPYNIDDVAGWGTTLNSRVFDFTVGTTKKQAIEKICNYCRYIFHIKWRVTDGVATPAAYFISEDDIDTALDLPAAVTFAYPDKYLADSINVQLKGDERYNRVTVIGRDNLGGVFTASEESASVTNGDEIAVEYIENSGSWTTQAQVNARAVELFAYYSETAYTYTATLLDRMDLELLQKIRITGYAGVSENWMRITKIKKSINANDNGVTKKVDIEFTENVKWSALKRMYRYAADSMFDEMDTLINQKLSMLPGSQIGVVDEKDGQTAVITLEDGTVVSTRCV